MRVRSRSLNSLESPSGVRTTIRASAAGAGTAMMRLVQKGQTAGRGGPGKEARQKGQTVAIEFEKPWLAEALRLMRPLASQLSGGECSTRF